MSLIGLYPSSTPPAFPFPEFLLNLKGSTSDAGEYDDLEVAFSRVRQEMPAGTPAFRIVREGQPRWLHPEVRREAYRIGREALLNAFRHSQASHVEVEIEYAPTRLRISVRDNGKGVTPALFNSGVCHRGLSAMRELADRIGAKFKLLSRAAAGTEIELSIPGDVAFAADEEVFTLGWARAA